MMEKKRYTTAVMRTVLCWVLVCIIIIIVGFVLALQRGQSSIRSSFYRHEQHRRLIGFAELHDPRTIVVKQDDGDVVFMDSHFVVPRTRLDESKHLRPAIVQGRPAGFDHQGWVVDVLSIGSRTRPDYMIAQARTWGSHVHVRNFWGINEDQDYDPQCDQMDSNALQSYTQFCREDMGWTNNSLETFRRRNFGLKGHRVRNNAGWFCAQRRVGRGLGWLMDMYRDSANIPDVLIITDDDTSMDLGNLKHSMQQHSKSVDGYPFVGAACAYEKNLGFTFAYGGYGTFINKEAIIQLTTPILCGEGTIKDANNQMSCLSLQQNGIGELDVFQNGDSAFDLFYKYSATRQFCLHSDWALGYMIRYYLHENLQQVEPRRCKITSCDRESITCHNHGPAEMEKFVQKHH